MVCFVWVYEMTVALIAREAFGIECGGVAQRSERYSLGIIQIWMPGVKFLGWFISMNLLYIRAIIKEWTGKVKLQNGAAAPEFYRIDDPKTAQ